MIKELSTCTSPKAQMNAKNVSDNTTTITLNTLCKERIGDLLFLAGTILAFIVVNVSEDAALQTQQENKKSLNQKALETLAVESWIFFVASIIFSNTAITRLAQLEANPQDLKTTSDFQLLHGNKLATLGGIIKAVGFGISALGNQIKYDSTLIK